MGKEKFVHGPASVGECTVCHGQTGDYKFKPMNNAGKLCNECHDKEFPGKEGKMEEASGMFKQALEINHMDMNIFIYKRVYVETNKAEEAEKAYRQALEFALSN